MRDAETDVRIRHCRNILRKRHSLASVRIIGNRLAEVLRDQLDRLEVQAVGKLPCRRSGIAFDRMGQRVHTCGGGKTLGHGGHHIRINDRDVRYVVRVYTDKLTLPLNISNDIVNRRLRAGTAGCRDGDRKDRAMFGRRNAFKRTDIIILGIVYNNADSFSRIH